MQQRGTLFVLLCAVLVTACDPDYVFLSVQSDPSLPPSATEARGASAPDSEGHGRFIGVVRIGKVDYFGDALVAEDGRMRLYVGGPYATSDSLQVTRARGAMQFVGTIDLRNGGMFGSGVILREGCGPGTGCSTPISAELNIAAIKTEMRGEIRLLDPRAPDEIWSVEMAKWDNYYAREAAIPSMAGQYEELISEFSERTRTLIRIDEGGKLSFEDAQTGCSGRGTMTPHSSGAFNVYDVEIRIKGCDSLQAFMSGDWEGLAAESASSVGDSDSLLRIWLSIHAESDALAAVTLLARRW
jgi:hypothetical protein